MRDLESIKIRANNLPDAWFQTLYTCVDVGKEFTIDRGSYAGQKRLEFDWIDIEIENPGQEPLIPQVPEHHPFPSPVDENYLADYMPYLLTGEEKPGEAYTYGQRLNAFLIPEKVMYYRRDRAFLPENLKRIVVEEDKIWEHPDIMWRDRNGNWYLNQVELMIYTYKNFGERNNQMILQVGMGSDMLLQDPPCLRHIDTRLQDGKLHFFPYFRSWDLFNGLPANLAAIETLKQYCADAIGVENGSMIASSKGLHIYDHVWEIAESIRGKSINEWRDETMEVQGKI